MVENTNAMTKYAGPGEEKMSGFSQSFKFEARINLIAKTTGIKRESIAIILVKIVVPFAVLCILEIVKLTLTSFSFNLEKGLSKIL